ncbi:52 kDa repressor of the inhibitor of the protein kinase-like [Melanaphis sacchari]|uniref:52 kDa repressor of the inhibitor of the protein kinase-like n=1 Tax=Melanaphis sacchari TaxID=742174 RepID=UPI000DC12E20|nr:52 kDa repressor of the inhibitor of the protein kinase-like [Melanaphis sacchari]
MKRSMSTQSSIFNFFHKKNNQGELDSELISTEEEIPCASTTEKSVLESTLEIPKLRDVGRYVNVRITEDKFKYDLLKNPWLPSSNYNFPVVSKRKLKFQMSWLSRFSWLVYSEKLEGALCKICVLFSNECIGKGSNQKVGALVSKPFIKWKDALECFKLHSNADYHKLSVIRADEFLKMMDSKKPDISIAIDSAYKNLVLENRAKLVPIIETIIFCGRQEMALRGDNDSGHIFSNSDDNNDGNFRSLLRFRVQSGDLTLKAHLENSAANAVYISPLIQNELIHICGTYIQTQLVTKIKQAGFFSILADETCDISRIEQMSLCVRYIEDCRIREDFLTFIPIYDASGKGLAHTIIHEIDKLGLKKENLVGQGYDGASSMSGIYNGVQKNICNIVPHALYVHCAAHSLNLAISKSCNIPEIRNCIGSISTITSFFRKSPIRSDILKKFIKDLIPDTRQQTLLKMCETRWVERHDSLLRFKELYLPIANTLRELEHHHNLETSQHAFQLSKTITSSSFVISLYVTEKLFAITLSLCKSLQKINVDLSECCAYVNNCVQVINSIRENSDEEFHKLFLEVENVLSLVDETVKTPRLVRQSIYRNNILADSPEHFLPTYDTLESELKVWIEKWKSVPDKKLPKSAIDTLDVMSKDLYPNIWCLLSILATLPVSTSSAERTFSTLRRLKSYLRNSCSENRLTGLALLSVHRSISIDIEEIINIFSRMPRKVDFVL